jgi:hypothetical protein
VTPADLEREIHEALRRLPPPRAPGSLAPRLMAALRAGRAAPWHARPMATWPVVLQALVTALAGVPLAIVGLWPWGGGVLQDAAAALGLPAPAACGALLPSVVRQTVEQASAAVVLWRVLLGPVLVYAAAFAVAVGCVFTVCAAALARVVLGRMSAQAS